MQKGMKWAYKKYVPYPGKMDHVTQRMVFRSPGQGHVNFCYHLVIFFFTFYSPRKLLGQINEPKLGMKHLWKVLY